MELKKVTYDYGGGFAEAAYVTYLTPEAEAEVYFSSLDGRGISVICEDDIVKAICAAELVQPGECTFYAVDTNAARKGRKPDFYCIEKLTISEMGNTLLIHDRQVVAISSHPEERTLPDQVFEEVIEAFKPYIQTWSM